MITSYVKNGLVMVVILLFVGVAVQPSIMADVSIESDKSEMEEITVQFYETDKTYNHTVMLTQEQVIEFEELINNFEIDLDCADSIDETEVIFKDTVVSLNELGLLPDGMSVEEAQRLVTGLEHNSRIVKLLERWIDKNPKFLGSDRNALCLIAGRTNQTGFLGPIATILLPLILPLILEVWLVPYFGLIVIFILAYYWYFLNHFPIAYGHKISFGAFNRPAEGWLITLGLNGIKKWSGSFYGHIPSFLPLIHDIFHFFRVFGYPGVFGFTGIQIWTDFHDSNTTSTRCYFGTALWVNIGEGCPWESICIRTSL